MFRTVWKFEVRPEAKAQFEKAYGPDGDWAKLFRKAEGYVDTELFREIGGTGYLTVDTWQSAEEFEKFKTQWRVEYENLDQVCEDLTLSEFRIC